MTTAQATRNKLKVRLDSNGYASGQVVNTSAGGTGHFGQADSMQRYTLVSITAAANEATALHGTTGLTS